MKIGRIDLGERPVLLAPMEDVTDIGFRLLCRRLGASMVYSEFVAADALVRFVKKSLDKLSICDEERPVAIQIYGKDPEAMRDAAQIVAETARPDVLDLNFGCPVKKVAGKGAGAGLLKDVPRMLEITRKVVDAVDIPVTAKTRLGWSEESKIIVPLAEQLQDCGISALTIHGRTRAAMYTGEADWTLIKEVKKNPRMRIPVIGNGDITSGAKALEAFERFGVDAVMVGRATFGAPWIFKEIDLALHGSKGPQEALSPDLGSAELQVQADAEKIAPGSKPEKAAVESQFPVLSPDWKIDVLKEQVRNSVERIDEYRGILHIRRHLAASPLFKGIPDFRPTRIAMLRANTLKELFEILDSVRPLIRNSASASNSAAPAPQDSAD